MQTGRPVTRCRASVRAKPIVEISFCCQQLSVPDTTFHKSKLALVSASLLAATLGSVHAFSVFLIPLESSFETTRSMVSLTYSLALVALTVAVLLGHHVFSRFSPSVPARCIRTHDDGTSRNDNSERRQRFIPAVVRQQFFRIFFTRCRNVDQKHPLTQPLPTDVSRFPFGLKLKILKYHFVSDISAGS